MKEGFQKSTADVSAHLGGISYGTEKIMRYLALVSRYAQSGLDEALLNLLLEEASRLRG